MSAATGSPRYGHELNLPGLRMWPLARCPQVVFYVEQADTCGRVAGAAWAA